MERSPLSDESQNGGFPEPPTSEPVRTSITLWNVVLPHVDTVRPCWQAATT